MTTAFSIKDGLLSLLTMDFTAFAPFTTPEGSGLGPKKDRLQENAAYFKIYLGLEDGKLSDPGGDLPDTHMFDYNGRKVGGVRDPGSWVAPGSSAVYWAGGEHEWKKRPFQPIYTLFTANNDAICVALATTSFPGLSGHYAWLGDWGSHCARNNETLATWYYSGVVIPGTNYAPNCLWIDRDGSQPATAFQVNWIDLKPGQGEDEERLGKSPDDMCQTPSFNIFNSYDPVQIIYEPKETDEHGIRIEGPKNNTRVLRPAAGPRTRRSVAAAKLRFEQKWGDVLIIDDVPDHTAHSLCQSPNSAGPSFLNEEEGYYCDMHSKTLHPVCKKEKEQDKVCFDTEQIQLVGPGLQKRSVPFKVQDWRLNRGESVDASAL